jgi:hypothetical protein
VGRGVGNTSFVRGVIDARETQVHTDGWRAYAELARQGVAHRLRVQGRGPRARKTLPWAHTVISNLKTWLRGTFHGVSPKRRSNASPAQIQCGPGSAGSSDTGMASRPAKSFALALVASTCTRKRVPS